MHILTHTPQCNRVRIRYIMCVCVYALRGISQKILFHRHTGFRDAHTQYVYLVRLVNMLILIHVIHTRWYISTDAAVNAVLTYLYIYLAVQTRVCTCVMAFLQDIVLSSRTAVLSINGEAARAVVLSRGVPPPPKKM